MNYFINRWLSVLTLTLLALGAWAQSQPVQCNSGKVPKSYNGWDWEVTPDKSIYCDTWSSTYNGRDIESMGAPWNAPKSRPLIKISQSSDFKKSDGWELVRLDFGGNQGTDMPNFILYNKYQAKLRVFAWVVTSQTFTRAIMTMEHVAGAQNNGQVTSVSGLSQSLLRAPDKYLASNQGDDLTTYVCGYGGKKGWVMGEFTMLFDPNSTDGKYYESSLLFKVYGIVNSTITLGGDFRFTTAPDEGYGFSGPTSKVVENPGANAKKFLASGTKFLGQFDKLSDQVKAISTKSGETAATLAKNTDGVLGGIQKTASFISKNTGDASALKGILSAASSISGIFGVAGTVAGLLWPSDNGPTTVTPTPTVSSGSIQLTGTIETTTLIGSTTTEEPGVPHNFNGSTNAFRRASQPYYDCPMGLFNLRQTPQLARYTYPRAKVVSGYRGQVPEESYTSYSVQEDLTPVFNQTSGMQVISVKAAIVQKVRYSSLASLYTYDKSQNPTRFNRLYAEVEVGNLEAVPFDNGPTNSPTDDTYLVQTPFVDAGCFKGMAFNAPTDSLTKSPAFVRIIATLRRIGAPATDAPYYFTQDYAFDAVAPSSANPPLTSDRSYLNLDDPTPYFSGNSRTIAPLDVTWTGTVFQQYGQFFTAPRNLIFDPYSSLKMDVVRNGGSAGYGGGVGGFRAGNTISFQGELSIPFEMDVYMTTDPLYNRSCANPGLVAQGVGSCNSYNSWATTTRQIVPAIDSARPASAGAVMATIQLAPNPATQSTTVRLLSGSAEAGPGSISRVEVLNLSGQPVWQAAPPTPTAQEMEIPLRGLATGLYVVRVITASGSYVEKLVVQ